MESNFQVISSSWVTHSLLSMGGVKSMFWPDLYPPSMGWVEFVDPGGISGDFVWGATQQRIVSGAWRLWNSLFLDRLMQLIDLDQPNSWPAELYGFLEDHHDLFRWWETKTGCVSAPMFDEAIGGLANALLPYELVGWHCTRLTDVEIEGISRNGMQLPDAAMLARRIDAVVEANGLEPDVARLLKDRNQAGDENRAGMIWFCFFPPKRAGEAGIGRFFRHWGGEALYNSHEQNPVSSSAISDIGTPCIVEANVPIASLAKHGGLEFNIVHRFLTSRGLRACGSTDYEGRIVQPLSTPNIRRVIRFPDRDFLELTGCSEWRRPIAEPKKPSR